MVRYMSLSIVFASLSLSKAYVCLYSLQVMQLDINLQIEFHFSLATTNYALKMPELKSHFHMAQRLCLSFAYLKGAGSRNVNKLLSER